MDPRPGRAPRRNAPRLRRVFLLSPARVNGVRAGYLLNPAATFALARQFHSDGLPVADVFTFTSGLYFRGKITYARRFAGDDACVIRVITANSGLVDPSLQLTASALRAFGEVDIDVSDPRYHEPLRRDAQVLERRLAADGNVVLLGSIATAKYRDVLLDVFGARLVFPSDFVGRGDMSRGGLLLRSARDGIELPYASVLGATVHGVRPPRLPRLPRPSGVTTSAGTAPAPSPSGAPPAAARSLVPPRRRARPA